MNYCQHQKRPYQHPPFHQSNGNIPPQQRQTSQFRHDRLLLQLILGFSHNEFIFESSDKSL